MFIHEGNAPTRNSAHLLDPVRFRMEGLFALQLFDDLAQEAAKILSEEELAIQSNPSRSNSIDSEVATAMRLLLCEIKVMTGRGDEAVEQLHLLQAWLLKVAELSEDIAMQKRAHCWLARTGCAIVNSFIRQRQWRLAISALREILSRLQQNEKGSGDAHHLRDAIIVIHCLLARTLLQVFAIMMSEVIFTTYIPFTILRLGLLVRPSNFATLLGTFSHNLERLSWMIKGDCQSPLQKILPIYLPRLQYGIKFKSQEALRCLGKIRQESFKY